MEEELKALTDMANILSSLDRDTQTRIVAAVCLLLNIPRVKNTIATDQ